MARKNKTKTSPRRSRRRTPRVAPTPPSDTNLLRALAALEEQFNRRRAAYRRHVESTTALGPREKAEAWLTYFAQSDEDWGDQEALVYLCSRGHPCTQEIEELVSVWKRAEIKTIELLAEGTPVFSAGKRVRTVGRMSLSDAADVRKHPSFELRNFWSGADSQQFTIDATMLRTAEWCEIGGFGQWWERLAEELNANALRGGIEPVPASNLLFNYCRSDYARRLMPETLQTVLRALKIGDHDPDAPWRVFISFRPNPGVVAHLGYASAFVFAEVMLRSRAERSEALIANATEELLRQQRVDGSWSTWAADANSSIGTTAMALHALALVKPFGWERSVERGKNWLWQVQHQEGYWKDDEDPDPIYLTVLVLDAIELAQGGLAATFSLPTGRTLRGHTASRPTDSERRFLVALSFPGEARKQVVKIADLLAKAIGRERVFYDAYYKAELAQPNLDTYLQSIYRDKANLIVPFISADYSKKEWCGLEWRAIRTIIKEKRDSQIMPIRLDDADLPPGLFSIDGYLDFRDHTPRELVQLILERAHALDDEI